MKFARHLLLLPLFFLAQTLFAQPILHKYDNGNKRIEGFVDAEGKMAGVWIYWYENGNIDQLGQYKNNQKFGLWRNYSAEGHLVAMGKYNGKARQPGVTNKEALPTNGNNEKATKVIDEWKDVNQAIVIDFAGDTNCKEGEWSEYDREGKKIKAYIFKEGKLIKAIDLK